MQISRLSFIGKRKKFILNAFVDFKPMQRFENRGDVTEFGSLNHSPGKRVGAGDNYSYKTCEAPVNSSPPANEHPTFLQVGCPSCRPTNSVEALKGKVSI